ncbi:MAG: glycosyltransferase family 9 protein [Bacteroidota bacterium]
MKCLIIQTAFIGDVILATPLIEKIHRFYPDAEIDFLLRKGNESLLHAHPHVHEVLIWDKKKDKYKGLLRILGTIRRNKYDQVINCQRFAASGLLTACSGARQTVGFDKNPFSMLFSKRVPHRFSTDQEFVHEVSRNLSLIEHLTDASFERPKLYPTEHDRQKAGALVLTKPYICIAPTSVWFTKQFPAHKWVELINVLPKHIQIFLLGAPSDFEACEAIRTASNLQGVYNVAGKLSFLESAALMAEAVMNYVNDSAPLHLASSVNAPVTAVFCSTIPAFGFTPLSTESRIIETTQKLDCRPCGLHGYKACPKGHFKCAESIEINVLKNKGTV